MEDIIYGVFNEGWIIEPIQFYENMPDVMQAYNTYLGKE